jgi:hypothetical protein
MKRTRTLLLVGFGLTVVGIVVWPLLLLALPAVLVASVLMLKGLWRRQRWTKDYKAAYAQALRDLSASPLQGL